LGGDQPGGGWIWTILSHLGHARICPMAATSRTWSRAWHVVQVTENRDFPTVKPGVRTMRMPNTTAEFPAMAPTTHKVMSGALKHPSASSGSGPGTKSPQF
jgi:hypothetical protein